jgi:predicted nucleic acid binding AN1-type Zn finger protein
MYLKIDAHKKIKCKICRKKITLTFTECRCGRYYCDNHKYPQDHNCTFDHIKHNQNQIALKNPVMKKFKFEKI